MEVRTSQIEKMVTLVTLWELDAVSILTALRNLSTVRSVRSSCFCQDMECCNKPPLVSSLH
jgi:hypothetical protein